VAGTKEGKTDMEVRILDSNRARAKWRDVLDAAAAGTSDIVIERYGKPVVAVIAYDDYVELRDELDEQRAARRATAIYEEWKREPSSARPYSEIRSRLVAKGFLDDEQEPTPLDDTGQSSG
jgi:prevent-host-death family protein